jgi:hypothetical protein
MILKIKQWEDIFEIDGVSIVDEKGWNPYALAEGLADDSTLVELDEVQIGKLSPLSSDKIKALLEFKNS